MNRKKIVITTLLTLAIFVIVGGGLWYAGWFKGSTLFFNGQKEQEKNSNTAVENIAVVTPLNPVAESRETSVTRLARLFAERFGTFSTDEGFAGITEIKPLMTSTFASWVDSTYIPLLKSRYPSGYGAETTRALRTQIVKQGEVDATVRVIVQRTMISDSAGQSAKSTTLRIDMVKEGDSWLVSGVFDEGK